MSFGEHLEELRKRILYSLLGLLVAFLVSMGFYKPLVGVMVQPHFKAIEMVEEASPELKIEREFLALTYTAPFLATLKMAFIFGLFVASPWVAYHMWAFIAAGLYQSEKKYLYYFACPSFLLFILGCLFGYFILLPYGLYGLTQIQVPEFIDPRFSFSEYLSLVMLLTIVMGAVFELPLLMIFFSKVGLIEPESYSKWRKFAIVGMFVVAALLTPPDVFTQLMMVGPLIFLWELGILLSKLAVRKRKAE